MSRKDLYHHIVIDCLLREGWKITDDPLDLSVGDVELMADLGAERVIGAERNNEKIAIEVKSFIGQSPVSEFHKALGQYENYRLSLEELDPDRMVWLAIPAFVWLDFFQRPFIQKSVARNQIKILTFDPLTKRIESWIK